MYTEVHTYLPTYDSIPLVSFLAGRRASGARKGDSLKRATGSLFNIGEFCSTGSFA